MRINITKNGSALHLSRAVVHELKRILTKHGIDPYLPFVLMLSIGDETLYAESKQTLDIEGDIG